LIRSLILGGASCVWDDLEFALSISEFDRAYTVNDITTIWRGPITACVSLHTEKWPYWLAIRKKNGLELPNRVVGHLNYKRSCFKMSPLVTEYIDHLYPGQNDAGSSGLFAIKVALDDGADRVVVCGCPMTEEGRHYFDKRPWGGAVGQRRGWRQSISHIKSRTRSCSGWTMELLGKPTFEWLVGDDSDGEIQQGCGRSNATHDDQQNQ